MSALTWTGGTVIREKRHRLAAVTYRGIKVVSFTANVKCRTHFFWQKDFYDHIVRDEDETGRHIRYILNNPVKQGLVRHWKDYPFMGSTLLDLGALLRS